MKKFLVLILVVPIIAAACGLTYVTKYVDNYGGSLYLGEKDVINGGNELIVVGNTGAQSVSQFGKNIIADAGIIAGDGKSWMTKGEYVYLAGIDPYKFEEVEWWATNPGPQDPPANVYINKYTTTDDISQHQFLSVTDSNYGSDTMQIATDGYNHLYEAGNVVIWHDSGDGPGIVKPPTEAPDKPYMPPLPDP